MGAAGDRFLASRQRKADAAGKTRVELLAMKAAQLGVSDAAAAAIAKIDAASRTVTAPPGIVAAQTATAELGEKAALSVVQIQSLTHSVRAFFDQVAAGGSPLRAFAVESAKLTGAFGTGAGALQGVVSLIT